MIKTLSDTPISDEASVLFAESVSVVFGGLVAVNDVTVKIGRGEIFGIIGPNGAGKTTLFNALTGMTPPTSGRVSLAGVNITRDPAWMRVKLGMARTFQNIRLFPELTAFQTVLIGRHVRREKGNLSHFLGTQAARLDEEHARERAMAELEFVGMENHRNILGKNLAYGDRRRVEIARALATEPSLLLLDEPAAGMNPQECDELLRMVERIRARGITVALVEHHMRIVMAICDRIAVLDHGLKIAEGTSQEVQADPAVIEAYLGKRGRPHARA